MKEPGEVNLAWALALLRGLVSAGVERMVVSPGSRNTPLLLAADLMPGVHAEVVVDERSAAFLALGMAKATRRPVGLVATSGSAPGNWLPAVLEADEAEVPLLLLSADRPWELQACGANQTTDQTDLFGGHLRAFHGLPPAEAEDLLLERLYHLGRQAVWESLWPRPGPVHLNLPFREPLVPVGDLPQPAPEPVRPHHRPRLEPEAALVEALVRRAQEGFGLVLAGAGCGSAEAVLALGEALGVPVLADALSGVRFCGRRSPVLIDGYGRFLEDEARAAALRPDWILQLGRLPLSAALHKALRAWKVADYWVATPQGRFLDPLNLGIEPVAVTPERLCSSLAGAAAVREEPRWLHRWRHASQREGELPWPARLVRTLLDTLPAESLLFCGNSLAVRWVETWAEARPMVLQIHANRGVSGIDGNLSTFLGMARCHGSGARLALLGDLTFQHDLGGLAAAGGVNAQVVVLANGGGGIFEHMPQRRLPAYEKYWKTPQRLDLAGAARLFGVAYHRVESLESLAEALETFRCRSGVALLELVVPGEGV